MTISQAFRVSIAVPPCDQGRIVTDRVAAHQNTTTLNQDPRAVSRRATREKYRDHVVALLHAACAERDEPGQLADRFERVANMIDVRKAIAFHVAAGEGVASGETRSPETPVRDGNLLHTDLINSSFLHPLVIALLAYRMGGAVNAAHTAYAHEWRPPAESATDSAHFHIEGDCKDIFDEYRVTLVWETHGDTSHKPSGSHNVFAAGDATPRPLSVLFPAGKPEPDSPVAIIYSPSEAALYYDSQDPDAVRHSVSLDFHVNAITNNTLDVFWMPRLEDCKVQELTLAKLITEFPIHDYANHFDRLLFGSSALDTMVSMLESFDVPCETPHLAAAHLTAAHDTALRHRYRAWALDNQANIPPAIRALQHEIILSGNHNSVAEFMEKVCLKACRDVHLPIGINIAPQSPIDEQREYARKYIRDQPVGSAHCKLAQYARILITRAYTSADLLPTSGIRAIGQRLETRCLELTSAGFIDPAFLLPAIGSFSSTLGNVLDGIKEISVSTEPWLTDSDLQIFRTRCIYLFWSADWLARYLARPHKGPMMVRDVQEEEIVKLGEEAGYMAQALLRNWVAWGLFVEGLPQGGFVIRRSLDLGV